MSKVERLLTQPERDKAAKAQVALDAVRDVIDDLPAAVIFPMVRELKKAASPRQGKPRRPEFSMITPEMLASTVEAIRDLPSKDRPKDVSLAFTACLSALDWDNGRILLMRSDLARMVGVDVAEITKAMGVLERMGVILKSYEPIPGNRGRGNVVYWINPHVAWKGDREIQDTARESYPKPQLVR